MDDRLNKTIIKNSHLIQNFHKREKFFLPVNNFFKNSGGSVNKGKHTFPPEQQMPSDSPFQRWALQKLQTLLIVPIKTAASLP